MADRSHNGGGDFEREELHRIRLSASLAATLLALAWILEPPLSVLVWLLVVPAFASMISLIIATRMFLRRDQSSESPRSS
jgi:hypothetical protein